MKKSIFFILFTLLYISVLQAQEKRNSIAYQYLRTNTTYDAYTIFLQQDSNPKIITFELVTNSKFDRLAAISLRKGNKLMKIQFDIVNSTKQNDNKNLKSLSILPNLDEIWTSNVDCETTLIFLLDTGRKIELPFLFCDLKKLVK